VRGTVRITTADSIYTYLVITVCDIAMPCKPVLIMFRLLMMKEEI
jgi:hypothetical protein